MKKYWPYILFGLCGAFALELILICIHSHWLEKLAWAGEAITGIVAVTALIGFIYQVKHDTNLSATDLIGFFREKIIDEKNKFDEKIIKANGGSYNFQEQWIELKKFTLPWLRLYHKDLADKQVAIHIKEPSLGNAVLKLFNILEEFSLKVEYMHLIEDPALSSVRAAYISTIEENSNWILTYILLNPDGYPGIQKLYPEWKKFGQRDTDSQKLEKAKVKVQNEITLEKEKIDKENKGK